MIFLGIASRLFFNYKFIQNCSLKLEFSFLDKIVSKQLSELCEVQGQTYKGKLYKLSMMGFCFKRGASFKHEKYCPKL